MTATESATTTSRTMSRDTSHAGLTAEAVVDAALAIVEAEGADALSMRRLASELGVATTSIYWHVGNRDQLLVALIGRLAERLGSSEVHGDDPAEQVRCAARNIWSSARSHRNVTALATRSAPPRFCTCHSRWRC
ncbi:MAG: TetR family transcriptional regulator [Microthrixaceae bacterium]